MFDFVRGLTFFLVASSVQGAQAEMLPASRIESARKLAHLAGIIQYSRLCN